MKRIVVLMLFAAAVGGAQRKQPIDQQAADLQRRMVLSEEQNTAKEAALSASLLSEMQLRYPMVTDPTVTGYMNDLARQVADVRVNLIVFKTDEVRAGTLPGGHVYVSTGLIAGARSEADLARVLAHEIGHQAACHAFLRQTSPGQPGIPLLFVGGWGGVCSKYDAELPLPSGLRAVYREREQEADRRASEYLEHMPALSDPTKFDEIQQLCKPAPKVDRVPSLRRQNG
jgi:predicted Zn-dependent protease